MPTAPSLFGPAGEGLPPAGPVDKISISSRAARSTGAPQASIPAADDLL